MADGPRDRPTPTYLRTIFHLGLFGLFSLLFSRVPGSTSAWTLALKIVLAAALPFYPAVWASRIRSRMIVAALIIVVVAANVYLLYLEVDPGR